MHTVICIAEVLEDNETKGQAEIHGHLDDAGNVVGWTVECLIRQGPPGFESMHVVATLTCPVGEEIPNLPQVGQTLLICSVQGDPNDWYVMGALPGGVNRTIPRNAAGVDMSGNGLAKTQVNMPPKGVGIRYYIRGGAFVIKLKGVKENYKGELYIEADDASDSPDGKTGTFIRIVRDQTSGKMAVKMRDATGAGVTCIDGAVLMQSPDNENTLQLDNDGFHFNGKLFEVNAPTARIDGSIFLNYPIGVPPTPATGAVLVAQAGGSVLGVAAIGKGVYVGAVLWQRSK